jgi:hypothetical protein
MVLGVPDPIYAMGEEKFSGFPYPLAGLGAYVLRRPVTRSEVERSVRDAVVSIASAVVELRTVPLTIGVAFSLGTSFSGLPDSIEAFWLISSVFSV